MARLSENAFGLLLRIGGDATEAVDALKKTESAAKGVEEAVGKTSPSFLNMAAASSVGETAGRLLGDAIKFIGAEAYQAAIGLFTLSKSTADFGQQIFKATQQTGLSAERISALKFAADETKTSFEQVTNGIGFFAKTIDSAAQGTSTYVERVNRLKITTTDLDGALKQALTTIVKTKSGTEQLALAQLAFGQSVGSKLLPVIQSFGGDLDGLTKRAKEFGATISDQAAKEANEFNKTLDDLSVQVAGLGHQIGFALIPKITELAKELSNLIKNNQGEIQTWSARTGLIIQGVAGYWEDLKKKVKEYNDELGKQTGGSGLKATDFGTGDGLKLNQAQINSLATYVRGKLQTRGVENQQDTPNIINAPETTFVFKSDKQKKEEADALEKAEKDREEARKRDLASQKEHIKLLVNAQSEEFKQDQKGFEEAFAKKEITEDQFRETSERNYEIYAARVKKLLLDAFQLDAKDKTAAEIANLRLAKDAANTAIDNEIQRQREARDKSIESADTQQAKDHLDSIKTSLDDEIALRESANDVILAKASVALEKGEITEKQFNTKKQLLEIDLNELKLKNLNKELDAVKGNALEEARIKTEIKLQEDKIAQTTQEQLRENAALANKTLQEHLAALKTKLAIEMEILDAERHLLDVRANNVRNQLRTDVNNSVPGKDRSDAFIKLRDFEIAESLRKQKEADADIVREKNYAIAHLSDLEKELGEQELLEKEYRDRTLASDEEFENQREEIRKQANRDKARSDHAGTFRGKLEGALGINIPLIDPNITDQVAAQADLLKNVYDDLATSTAGALATMAQGLANLLTQWIVTGKFSAQAALQMAAGVLLGLAIESGIKALFQLAEGYAALSNPFTAPLAAGHFAAAHAYAVVAAAAGATGVAFGAASRLAGGNKASAAAGSQTSGAGGTGSSSNSYTNPDQHGQVYSGLKPQTGEAGLNREQNITVTLSIKDDSTFLGKMLKADFDSNGQGARLIKATAANGGG